MPPHPGAQLSNTFISSLDVAAHRNLSSTSESPPPSPIIITTIPKITASLAAPSYPSPSPHHPRYALVMSGSGSEQDLSQGGKKAKSRRPGNTAFRQQRLKAWQPILTPKTVLPLFFILGVIFGPIGGILLWASAQVQEIIIDYTDCLSAPKILTPIPTSHISTSFKTALAEKDFPKWSSTNTTVRNFAGQDKLAQICTLQFTIPNQLNPPVLFYYRLNNFYQNHRRYVQSLDEDQLAGDALTRSQLEGSDDCNPLIADPDTGKPYYPCGLIANSMFNDSFTSPTLLNATGGSNSSSENYEMTTSGIAWSSDQNRYGKTKYTPDQVVPPRNWVERFGQNYTADTMPDLSDWEEFQVWMRTAGLPVFSKLARRNDNDVMKAGTYQVNITYNFPVEKYSGTKSIVISTRTVMGGKNPFLGGAYVVVSGVCFLLGALFTARHLFRPRKLGDHTYLSWNKEGSAMAR